MQTSQQQARDKNTFEYKWIVTTVVIFGAFMSVLDQTIVNVALPRLQHAFHADLNGIQWVLTGYILTQGVITPMTPFVSSRLGNKNSYLLALILFTLGSGLCGFAWSLPALVVFRLLQGIGAALLTPLSLTLLYNEFPVEQRGVATGLFGIAALLAPAVGPTLGGYLVTYVSWQFIFFVNVPVGLVAILAGSRLLRNGQLGKKIPFDVAGFLLAASSLTCLLYSFSVVNSDGWSSIRVLGLLVGGVFLLALFLYIEWRAMKRGRQPLIDVSLFTNRPFLFGNIVNVFITFAFFGGLFLFPIYLQTLRSLSAFEAGLLLLPQAIASMMMALIGGRLVDRVGVRFVVLPGVLLLALATWLFSTVSLTTPFWWLQMLFLLRGIAIGLTLQPLIVGTLSAMGPAQIAQASSVVTVVRFIATSLGIAILATLVQVQAKAHLAPIVHQKDAQLFALQDALKLSVIIVFAALIALFFLRPEQRPHRNR
ncbi:MDR family MFS transporter [Dictyobacter aurantiacus]|uniref:MFS transporter n=1 Tax=Dictyobacter aurantiacus TaxID=1936993 RepID=A0A401Z9J9_9CHLR|nr:MDR family MFS transporter [Dictyobacter aurantiacus]GCE03547.1 MFS transporter [Dictyobacter aurantiacus]